PSRRASLKRQLPSDPTVSTMKVHSVHIRRFRSIESAALSSCGNLNVLIGKNNSGKSNVLATINLVQRHLSRGGIAGPWPTSRPADEFTGRACDKPIQIGIEYELTAATNTELRGRLQQSAPHLEKSVEQIK